MESKRLLSHTDGSTTSFGPSSISDDLKDAEQKYQLTTEKELLELIKNLPLPLRPDSLNIIGFGGHSVALRITLEGNEKTNFVGILRYIDNKTGLPEIPTSDEIHNAFAEYCLPELSVMLADADGNPMSLKLAPEIYGATLKDLSPLHLLSNPKALQQFGDFCIKTVELFNKERQLPDLVGHNQKGLSFSPLFTSNIMLEYGSNNLRLVDTDLMDENNVDLVSTKRKLALYARAAGIFTTSIFIRSLEKFFPQEGIKQTREKEVDQEFLEGIQDVISTLEEIGIEYRVVGSLAIAGHLESQDVPYPLSSRRKDGTGRDIDIIVLDRDIEKITTCKELFKKKRAEKPSYPEVSMTIPAFAEQGKKTILQKLLPRLTSRLAFDGESVVQKYGDLTVSLDKQELIAKEIEYQGVDLKTLAPETLFGLALTRNGVIKFKDLAKYELFCKTFSIKVDPKYIDFARAMRTEYRAEYRNFLTRQWVSILTKAVFDGALTK